MHGRRAMHTKFWLENQKGKRSLGRPRETWDDNIKLELTGKKVEGKCGIDLAQVRDQ
jgi:hypothetical protein